MGHAKPSMLKPGDHICRTLKNLRGSAFFHHGIYVGEDMVIHFLGAGKEFKPSSSTTCEKCGYNSEKDIGVVKTCLNCFLCGHGFYICDYNHSSQVAKAPNEVVETANELFKNNKFGEYSLTNNNCEHFAVYCKTGKGLSMQIVFGGVMDRFAPWIIRSSWLHNLGWPRSTQPTLLSRYHNFTNPNIQLGLRSA